MAFKMKGSPIKLGKIRGTTGHTSALKQKEAEVSALKHSGAQYDAETKKETKTGRGISESTKRAHDKGHKTKWDENHNERTTKTGGAGLAKEAALEKTAALPQKSEGSKKMMKEKKELGPWPEKRKETSPQSPEMTEKRTKDFDKKSKDPDYTWPKTQKKTKKKKSTKEMVEFIKKTQVGMGKSILPKKLKK